MKNQNGVVCMFYSIRNLSRRHEVVEFEHERCRSVYRDGVKWAVEKGGESEGVIMSLARFWSD